MKLLREPLVHFLGLAALLFVANAWFAGDDRELIEVDLATQDYLIEQQQQLQLAPLDEVQRQQVIEGFVEDEILVREARKRGFENSSRIRALLLQNMRFFMASEIPEPTEAELKAWFEANPERFASAPRANFLHVVYTDPETVPADTLERLQAGEDYTTFGDGGMMTQKLIGMGEAAIVSGFGPEQGAQILALDDEDWHGPYLSDAGAHFLKLDKAFEATVPDWEQAKGWVSTEWLADQNRQILDRELESMRENYRVEIEPRTRTP